MLGSETWEISRAEIPQIYILFRYFSPSWVSGDPDTYLNGGYTEPTGAIWQVCCPYFQWPCRCVSPDAIPPSVPASGTPPCAKKAQEARNSPLHSQREIPHVRRPALSQERRRKKKSACSVLNDSGGSGHQAGLQGQIRLPAGWGSRGTRAARCYLYIEGRRCRFCWCRSRRW